MDTQYQVESSQDQLHPQPTNIIPTEQATWPLLSDLGPAIGMIGHLQLPIINLQLFDGPVSPPQCPRCNGFPTAPHAGEADCIAYLQQQVTILQSYTYTLHLTSRRHNRRLVEIEATAADLNRLLFRHGARLAALEKVLQRTGSIATSEAVLDRDLLLHVLCLLARRLEEAPAYRVGLRGLRAFRCINACGSHLICVELPSGQVAFEIDAEHLPMFDWLPLVDHNPDPPLTRDENRSRLRHSGLPVTQVEAVQ